MQKCNGFTVHFIKGIHIVFITKCIFITVNKYGTFHTGRGWISRVLCLEFKGIFVLGMGSLVEC